MRGRSMANPNYYEWEFADLVKACRREGYVLADLTDQKLVDWKSNRGILSSRDMAMPKRRKEWLELAWRHLRSVLS